MSNKKELESNSKFIPKKKSSETSERLNGSGSKGNLNKNFGGKKNKTRNKTNAKITDGHHPLQTKSI